MTNESSFNARRFYVPLSKMKNHYFLFLSKKNFQKYFFFWDTLEVVLRCKKKIICSIIRCMNVDTYNSVYSLLLHFCVFSFVFYKNSTQTRKLEQTILFLFLSLFFTLEIPVNNNLYSAQFYIDMCRRRAHHMHWDLANEKERRI